MAKIKLTLTADRDLIDRAKRFAARRNTSVSALVSRLLQAVIAEESQELFDIGPLTKKASGIAKLPKGRSDINLLESALLEKYGFKR